MSQYKKNHDIVLSQKLRVLGTVYIVSWFFLYCADEKSDTFGKNLSRFHVKYCISAVISQINGPA